jgi:phosphoglucomutase
MARVFLGSGCDVRFAGIAAAPEIMAYARTTLSPGLGGFCYISASHNPIGHNGLKFGLDDGGVLEGNEAYKIIESFKEYLAKENAIEQVIELLEKTDEEALRRVYAESENVKQEALAAYRSFIEKIITGESAKSGMIYREMKSGLKQYPLGIAADFNGSARTTSIDEQLFRDLGLGFYKINGKAGEIAHAIIPEGGSLESCRIFLEKTHEKDPSVILGYMPDCDGDRGNLVIWDEDAGKARALEAQEVFALSCMAELAHMVWTGELAYDANGNCITKAAIAVNGPTSMRIDRIAKTFGIPVFRAEVGEANVVNLARSLRNEGFLVRILGEGSNGGNITHPSSVRDPIATVFALVKMLAVRRGGACNAGFFDIWQRKLKNSSPQAGENFSLSGIIASLPRFFTTGVSAPEAKLKVQTTDHALLKNRYQKIFEKEWNEKKDTLQKQYGISGWEARACIGTKELRKLSCFGDAQTGGLKIVFFKDRLETAFIWMRGSKTEPVFRIMADAEDSALERELICWQRDMVTKADGSL